MKIATVLLGTALLIVTAILVFLVTRGGALKPAGVIKPAEVGTDPDLIGKAIAIRLFPEFRAARNVIWYLERGEESFARIPRVAHLNYLAPQKPVLLDLRQDPRATCVENCWYLQWTGAPLPEDLASPTRTQPIMEIFVRSFDRDEEVPAACENEKILDVECVRPISVREVRRKLKTPSPHFFMQRYLELQFHLFIEKPAP